MAATMMSHMRVRERLSSGFALAALAALTLFAWHRLLEMAAHAETGHSATMHADGGVAFVATGAAMWSVMMVAMMLPAASPMIVAYSRIGHRRRPARWGLAPTWIFVAGYLAVWTGFSVLGALGQWALHEAALLDVAMGRTGPLFGGALLVLAGAFQWTPLKEACLAKCRTPLSFVLTEWRDGWGGAFVMGLRHGIFCLGCCWALMLLMFVGGVMSLAWMGGLAIYMLVERLIPNGRLFSRASGLVLIAAGFALGTLAGTGLGS